MRDPTITNFRKQLPNYLSWLTPWAVDMIRLGDGADGGYIIPASILDKADALLSMGLGENWTFDENWRQLKPNDPVHMYDGTVTKASLPEIPWQWPNRKLGELYEKFFNCTPGVKHYVEMIGNGRTDTNLETCINRLGSKNIFLKMDIEGGEYTLINDLIRLKDNIVCMATEMHGVNTNRPLFQAAVQKICTEYVIIHVHGNVGVPPWGVEGLTDALEITFLRKDLCDSRAQRHDFYLPNLDAGNHFDLFDIEYFFEEPNAKKKK
jgi:hypothetical protein